VRPLLRLAACRAACDSFFEAPPIATVLGGLHPRAKRQVGERLAAAAAAHLYGVKRAAAGPTLSGCAVRGRRLVLRFNSSLLRGERVALRLRPGALSPLQVLLNASQFCLHPLMRCPAGKASCPAAGREWYCPDPLSHGTLQRRRGASSGFGALAGASGLAMARSSNWPRPASPFDPAHQAGGAASWLSLPLTSAISAHEVAVDLTPLRGAPPVAVRYHWGDLAEGDRRGCCDDGDPRLRVTVPCEPAACPLVASGGLPASPFLALLSAGRCRCIPPQVCDEAIDGRDFLPRTLVEE